MDDITKPKIIVDSEKEYIMRYWERGLGKGSYPTTRFEVIINGNYAVSQLEALISLFQREIKDARKDRSEIIVQERVSRDKYESLVHFQESQEDE